MNVLERTRPCEPPLLLPSREMRKEKALTWAEHLPVMKSASYRTRHTWVRVLSPSFSSVFLLNLWKFAVVSSIPTSSTAGIS